MEKKFHLMELLKNRGESFGFIYKVVVTCTNTLEPPYKRPPYSGSVDGVLGCGA